MGSMEGGGRVQGVCGGPGSGWTRGHGKGTGVRGNATLVVFASFRSLFGIKFPYFGREQEIKNPVMNSDLVRNFIFHKVSKYLVNHFGKKRFVGKHHVFLFLFLPFLFSGKYFEKRNIWR